jgi:tetratricopeptide (TPR) repeat protein
MEKKIFKKIRDRHREAAMYSNLGILEIEQGDWEAALDHLNKDLDITSSLGDPLDIAQCNNNIGLLFSKKDIFEKAIEYYRASLGTFKDNKDPDALVRVTNNLGDVLIKAGYLEEAENNLKYALKISSDSAVSQYTKSNLYLILLCHI